MIFNMCFDFDDLTEYKFDRLISEKKTFEITGLIGRMSN